MINKNYHTPVLLKESVDGLNIIEDGVYVDVTFGGGGHSKEILSRLGQKGRLIAFDSNRDGDSEIFIMNSDGKNQKQLTQNNAWDGMPNWGPSTNK